MLFNTLEYFLFFLAVFAVSWLTVGFARLRIWIILLASIYFYYSNNHWQTLLLLATASVDYLLCLAMARTSGQQKRRALLSISLVSNLGMLAYFKYASFIGTNLGALADGLGWHLGWVPAKILLPVGISFYTFEALSYTIDVYRGKIPPEREWNRLTFLVSFFPHLVAGPIVRAADFFPQLARRPKLTPRELELSLMLICGGLIKKIVFADTLAHLVDPVYKDPSAASAWSAWVAVYAFALQIYFDFSGYTDIALGSAKLLGFRLPENFRHPYVATSITDFWRRWHITLSAWLRDYLYVPLGGNRMRTRLGICRNLIVTMLLGGLWHGAAWNFVLWGGLHGLLLSAERLLGVYDREKQAAPYNAAVRLVRGFVFFNLAVALWIPFRSPDIPTFVGLIRAMTSGGHGGAISNVSLVAVVLVIATWCWQAVNEFWDVKSLWLRVWIPIKAGVYAFATLVIIVFGSETPQAFIYFRF